MPIDAVTAGSAATTITTNRKTGSEIDKDGFLKLLTEQLRNQDPSSNNDPTQYFQQISTMTMVEQLTNLATQSATSRAEALLGKTVTFPDPRRDDGTGAASHQPVTGTVERVDLSSGTPKLTVAGIDGVDPETLTEVR